MHNLFLFRLLKLKVIKKTEKLTVENAAVLDCEVVDPQGLEVVVVEEVVKMGIMKDQDEVKALEEAE